MNNMYFLSLCSQGSTNVYTYKHCCFVGGARPWRKETRAILILIGSLRFTNCTFDVTLGASVKQELLLITCFHRLNPLREINVVFGFFFFFLQGVRMYKIIVFAN